MTTIKKYKKTANFTQLDNRVAFDRNLSPAAKGIMTFLLALPNDWVISIAHLCNSHPKVGRTKITTILTELREEGYILRVDYRHKGKYGTEYTVFETREDRAAWLALNDVVDGQYFDYKPDFVIPDLSDPQDPGEPKQRKSRKTEEELRLAAEAKEAERKAKAEEAERKKAIKAEREKLAEEKREQDKAWRYELFGGKDRYKAFTSWFFATYAPNSGLDKPDAFYVIALKDLAADGEKYRHLVMQFEQFEKKEAKAAQQEQLNAQAAQIAEKAAQAPAQPKTHEAQQQPVQKQTEVTPVTVKSFLSQENIQLFNESNLRGELLEGCLRELMRVKGVEIMHERVIRQHRQLQERKDYFEAHPERVSAVS